jgi:hypothetical protein
VTRRNRSARTVGSAVTALGLLAACSSGGSSPARTAGTPGTAAAATSSLATSLDTPSDTFAVVPAAANPTFWEVFARPARSADWTLVTPSGVADNGGLVLAADGNTVTAAVRPSQDLEFTPLATTTNGGRSWITPAPVQGAIANTAGAFTASGNDLAALLSDGAIDTSADHGASWTTLARPGSTGSTAAGGQCGPVEVTTVSFDIRTAGLMAGGTCGTTGTTGVFSYSPGNGWRALTLPRDGTILRLDGDLALVLGQAGLTALSGAFYLNAPASRPLPSISVDSSRPLPVSGAIEASGTLGPPTVADPDGDGAWVLLSGRHAATIGSTGTRWRQLPTVPAGTRTLASGPDATIDALAVSGASLTVWQLAAGATAWAKFESIVMPIQYGSSS